MKTRKGAAILVVALFTVVALLGAVACGGDEEATTDTEASPSATEEMTTEELWADILGQEPTGLAAEILERGKVIVANDANYPPQSYVDEETNELVGFDVDVAKKMGEILDIPVEFETPAWETVPAGLDTGRWDVSIGSMTITEERQKSLDFTSPYYYTSGQVFVQKGGPQIESVDDLAGKTVGVGAATTYYDFLKENSDAKVKTYTTDAESFPDLLNGNIDFVMTAGPTGQEAILAGKEMEFSGTPLYYEDLAFSIKQGEPDWLALLDYAVKQMHEDGSLTAMSEEWYNGVDLTVKE